MAAPWVVLTSGAWSVSPVLGCEGDCQDGRWWKGQVEGGSIEHGV